MPLGEDKSPIQETEHTISSLRMKKFDASLLRLLCHIMHICQTTHRPLVAIKLQSTLSL